MAILENFSLKVFDSIIIVNQLFFWQALLLPLHSDGGHVDIRSCGKFNLAMLEVNYDL